MALQELAPGTVVGEDFRVVSTLAQGGMGIVYVALQTSTQKRRALKVMTPQPGDLEALRKRFEREAHLSSKIESEHVVEVIGAGVDRASNMPWMAMELLDGEDLEGYLARVGRLSWTDAWNITGELCHALEAAHRIGVVHRDLKPSNVFLARSRRPGVAREVKVLDFGIAKQTSDTGKTTGTLGTPLYMSPEQTMAGSTFSSATDVWALGLLVFEMLTGVSYWKTASADQAQIAMLLREVILEPLVPASQRAAELGADGFLPPGFDAWFARCVVREPSERWSDAGQAYASLATVFAAATGRADDGLPPPSSLALPPLSAHRGGTASPPTPREARTQPSFGGATIEPGSPGGSRLRILLGGTVLGGLAAGVVAFLLLSSDEPAPSPTASSDPPPAPSVSGRPQGVGATAEGPAVAPSLEASPAVTAAPSGDAPASSPASASAPPTGSSAPRASARPSATASPAGPSSAPPPAETGAKPPPPRPPPAAPTVDPVIL